MNIDTMTHAVVPRRFLFLGVDMRILLSTAESGDQFSLVEGIMPPGGDGGLHVHAFEDETMHLLEGDLAVTIGDASFELRAGETYFAPRNVPHRLRNLSNRPARGLLVTTPGGFDRFVEQAGLALADDASLPIGAPPTASGLERLIRLAKDFGITILAPPTAPT